MQAEIRLRVPNMKARAMDPKGNPIDHHSMRFRRVIEIPRFPHVGDTVDLPTSAGLTLQATVVHAELDEPRTLFVLSCRFAGKSISADDYAALSNDPEWELKHLLE
jgi:hypothetical protein